MKRNLGPLGMLACSFFLVEMVPALPVQDSMKTPNLLAFRCNEAPSIQDHSPVEAAMADRFTLRKHPFLKQKTSNVYICKYFNMYLRTQYIHICSNNISM